MREKKYADYLCYLEMESIVSENFFSDFDTAKYSHGKRGGRKISILLKYMRNCYD